MVSVQTMNQNAKWKGSSQEVGGHAAEDEKQI